MKYRTTNGQLIFSNILGYEVRSCDAQINRIYWTHNPSTGHIRIRIHGINLIILYIVCFHQFYLSVFGTETIIYNNVD